MAKLTQFVRQRFLRFRKEAVIMWYAFRHPDTPLHLKLASLLVTGYLLSPIDLIPIFVPVLGLVDDLIIVPFGVSQVVKRLPANVHEDAERKANRMIGRYIKRPLLFFGIFVAVVVLFWAAVLWWLIA